MTGSFADTINWANTPLSVFKQGLSGNKDALAAFNAAVADGQTKEDAYTAALQACSTEQERAQLVTSTLSSLYGEAGAKYQEVNGDLIAARQAQADWNAAVGEAGEAVRPLATQITGIGTSIVSGALPYLSQFATWASGQLPAVQGFFSSAMGGISGAIGDVATAFQSGNTVGESFGNAIQTLGSKVSEAIPGLVESAGSMMTQFGTALRENIPTIASAGLEMLTGLSASIGENLPMLAESAGQMILGLVEGLVASLPSLIEQGPTIISNICTGISNAMMTLFTYAGQILWTLVTGLIAAIPTLVANIPQICQAAWDAFVAFNWLGLGRTLITGIANGIKALASNIPNVVRNIFNNVKTAATNIWNGIKSGIGNIVNGIKTTVGNVFNALKTNVGNIFNGVKTAASTVWNGIKTAIGNVVNGIKTNVSNVFNGIKSTAQNIWNGVKSAIQTPIEKARDLVKGAIDKIKGFFNFNFSWPSLPLPHFSISPAGWSVGDLLKGSIPSLGISWYAKGGVFDEPTIFPTAKGLKGVGEAGAEAVAPIDVLMDYVRAAVGEKFAGMEYDIARLYKLMAYYMPKMLAASDRAIVLDSGALVGGTVAEFDRAMGERQTKKRRGQ